MKTVSGKILLGWMAEDEAMKTLLEEAVLDQPLDKAGAIALWECYRAKVLALGMRDCPAPGSGPLDLKEKLAGDRIIKGSRRKGNHNPQRVLKVDPLGLVVHQLQIIEERAQFYRLAMESSVQRVRTCLPPLPISRQLPYRTDGNKTVIDLPHSEFEMVIGARKNLEISENAQHIAVTPFGGKLLLWAGYHRAYALTLASQEKPDEIVRALPVVLTRDADFFLGERSTLPDKRDVVRSPWPPLFRDFFDVDLCMRIKLRKRRCQIEIDATKLQARKVWVDDES
jgi:hypothetical protein